jgi:hypothetical protein
VASLEDDKIKASGHCEGEAQIRFADMAAEGRAWVAGSSGRNQLIFARDASIS